ncbi:DUF1643 domain-containing protein [Granulosicoccaceae sp. 1_MG-2023]|nr:DUF1643 domain-containing protein [Granulosicoccaceae sp. 1_MG-2023]
MQSSANFSRCRTYRYALQRCWDEQLPSLLIIGLNPSTADAQRNDPTIRRCIGFARDWGFGRLTVANLFAYRATLPSDLKAAADPVGPRNNHWLRKLAREADLVVAAWGNDGRFMGRADAVRRFLPDLYCIRMNSLGEPAHPLYLKRGLRPVPMP